MSEAVTSDCPLCMEAFEIDDLHFYPCTCGYQICRFCWHRIRTDENGLCPACRKAYSEDPAMYRPLSQDEIQKIKKERKQKDVHHKQKLSTNRQHLSNIRVIQKHLVFVVGLSNKMADADVLKRPEYFGKYGKIVKIVINPNTNYAGPQGPSASAYITYTKEQDALKAILSINNTQPPLKIRASLGTTKYCTHYLTNQACPKVDCMYLHDLGDQDASFTKEDMQVGKHQLFEKNLLDNYVSSVQQRRRLHKSISETSEPDHLDSNSQEDWNEEVEENVSESLLPSQASWGSSKDHHINNARLVNNEVDYPELEPSGATASPKSSTVIPAQQTAPSTTSQPLLAPAKPEETQTKQQPIGDNKPSISTGWDAASDNLAVDLTITNDSNAYSWPAINDLGLSDLKINPSDDELGFDPFSEGKSALEDLMESERKLGVSTIPPTPLFSWDSFWPSNYSACQNPLSLPTSYSLFGASAAQQPLSRPQMMPFCAPINPVNPYQSQMQLNPTRLTNSSSQFRFVSPPNQSMQRFPQQLAITQSDHNQPYSPVASPLLVQQQLQQFQNQQFANQYCFNQPFQPSVNTLSQQQQTPTSTVSVTPSTTVSTGIPLSSDKNWQDGLRALLPNINISFSTNRPPPPPGFSKCSSELFSASAQQTPGILTVPSGLSAVPGSHMSTAANVIVSETPPQTNLSTSHDDPSILWSKVLSDRHKELETPEMAFPLPSESSKTTSSALNSQVTSMTQQQPILNLPSWNAIVSGNQPPKLMQLKSTNETLRSSNQPLHVSAKDISNNGIQKPQKPSPIFGSQKQAVKKPTAHVKPLKCTDGFTTVQNSSRQLNSTTSLINSGSRVSELDDFSTDLVIPSTMVDVFGGGYEFPAMSNMNASASSAKTNKKKKKKNREVEHFSEIIVGRVEVERPAISILEDERVKKSKNKKKLQQKLSPPPQRKSPPLPKQSKEQTAPAIRILKTDANFSGVTTPSLVQAIASGESSKTVLPDHEIVSRLTESTEKLLKNVLFETEAIKCNTEQISKDLKSALEKCKESSLSLSDLEKINMLLTPGKLLSNVLDDSDLVDTTDLERQVESAKREAKMLEARLNDVIRKNMASELETLRRNTKGGSNQQ